MRWAPSASRLWLLRSASGEERSGRTGDRPPFSLSHAADFMAEAVTRSNPRATAGERHGIHVMPRNLKLRFCYAPVFNAETHLKYIFLVGNEIGIKVNNRQTVHSNEFVQQFSFQSFRN